jgi:hypothetical protein
LSTDTKQKLVEIRKATMFPSVTPENKEGGLMMLTPPVLLTLALNQIKSNHLFAEHNMAL